MFLYYVLSPLCLDDHESLVLKMLCRLCEREGDGGCVWFFFSIMPINFEILVQKTLHRYLSGNFHLSYFTALLLQKTLVTFTNSKEIFF